MSRRPIVNGTQIRRPAEKTRNKVSKRREESVVQKVPRGITLSLLSNSQLPARVTQLELVARRLKSR